MYRDGVSEGQFDEVGGRQAFYLPNEQMLVSVLALGPRRAAGVLSVLAMVCRCSGRRSHR